MPPAFAAASIGWHVSRNLCRGLCRKPARVIPLCGCPVATDLPAAGATGVLFPLRFGAGTCGVLRRTSSQQPHKHRRFRVALYWCALLRGAQDGFQNRCSTLRAVGIENNNRRDLKDLRGMRRNTKSLKRNDGERKGILIAPLKLPAFLVNSIPSLRGFIPCRESGVGCGPKSCGADGKPTNKSLLP